MEIVVSVVITTFNRLNYLKEAVKSVTSQTFKKYELVIVNDNSTDGTKEYLNTINKKDPNINVIHNDTNKHLSYSRNIGYKNSHGHYVAYLDDDDLWYPEKLKYQVETLDNCSKDYGLTYCWMDIYDGEHVLKSKTPSLSGSLFEHLIYENPLTNGSCLLIRRNILESLGGFDESLRRGVDGDFLRRASLISKFIPTKYIGVKYRVEKKIGERITSNSKESISDSIGAHLKTLENFKNILELPKHRDQYAVLLLHLSRENILKGCYFSAIKYLWLSLIKKVVLVSHYKDYLGFVFKGSMNRR